MEVLDTSRRLGAGDRLSYRVVEERRDPVALYITDSGELEVPLIGRVPATGRTCKEIALAIKPMLEREYFLQGHGHRRFGRGERESARACVFERASAPAGRARNSAR